MMLSNMVSPNNPFIDYQRVMKNTKNNWKKYGK